MLALSIRRGNFFGGGKNRNVLREDHVFFLSFVLSPSSSRMYLYTVGLLTPASRASSATDKFCARYKA